VRRFFKVQLQTVWAPAITTLLFLVIFTVATGGGGPGDGRSRCPFADFIAPGLIVMGMLQNAFANASFSLLVGKIQGTIVDYLMPPLSTGELLAALVGGAVTRAFLRRACGVAGDGAVARGRCRSAHPWAVLWFGLMGAVFLSLIGVLTSIWADKFDHAAAVTNFVIAPLSLLSGTFYSVDSCTPAFRRSATPTRSSTSSRASATASSAPPTRRSWSAAVVHARARRGARLLCYACCAGLEDQELA
jgi:ABC-2 type transport system permease protein